MRRINIIVIIAFVALAAKAQMRISVDNLYSQWQTKNLNGPKNGGILDLVGMFNLNYPTYSGSEFLTDVSRPENEQKWLITVDRPNGFVSFAEGSDDASSESFHACVWKRSNGHKLFAIAFMQASSKVKAFTAFYDYNPSTGLLVPEKSLARLFTPNKPAGMLSITLPQYGKDMIITEYYINAMFGIRHVFPWDGMKPGRERVEIENLDEMWKTYGDQAMMDGDWPVTRYAVIDIDRDGSPELMLGAENDDYQAVFALFDGKWEMIAAKDYKRQLNFFPPKAVGSSGGCGTGCFFIDWTLLENSRPTHHIENVQEYHFDTDAMVDNYSLDGREVVHAEEGDRLVKSLGDAVDITIPWRPLR